MCNYHSFSDWEILFEKEAKELVKSTLKPKEIFYALVDFLVNKKIEVPPSKIRESLKNFHDIKELHDKLSDFFTSNLLSNELINYYAVWILKKHIQFDAIRDIRNKRLYMVSFISYHSIKYVRTILWILF